MVSFIVDNFAILFGGLTTMAAWFAGNAKRKIDGVDNMRDTYSKFVDDLTKRYDTMNAELRELRALLEQNNREISKLRDENVSLRKLLVVANDKYLRLKQAFEAYKSKHA